MAGAFIGTHSHVLFDSLMHGDMAPLAPWAGGNGLLGAVSYAALHRACVLAGVLGIPGWVAAGWRSRLPEDPG